MVDGRIGGATHRALHERADRPAHGWARWAAMGALLLPACQLLLGIEKPDDASPAAGGAGGAGAQVYDCGAPYEVVFEERGEKLIDGSLQGDGRITSGVFPGCTGSDGPEQVFAVRVTHPQPGVLTATIPASTAEFDSVIYARRDTCDDPGKTVLCADRHDPARAVYGGEILSFLINGGGDEVVYIIVDARDASAQGAFKLHLTFHEGHYCNDTIPIVLEPGWTAALLGRQPTNQQGNSICGNCPMNVCAGWALQTIYEITAPNAAEVTAVVTASHDTVLYTRADCYDPLSQPMQGGCVDNNGASGEEIALPGGPLPTFLFVDSGIDDFGDYTLALTAQ